MDSKSPSEELIKGLYARFGLAYYNSECLHRTLCHLYVQAPFKHREEVTRPRIEERFSEAYSLTLGEVITRLKGIVSDEFHALLSTANDRRKFLAHHFWFEKCHLMFSDESVNSLINDLDSDSSLFLQCDSEASIILNTKLQTLGVTQEALDNALENLQSGDPGPDLLKKRKPKKLEVLVRAWKVPVSEGVSTIILETDDGEFWQFCEVGLGWSHFTARESTWEIEEQIQQYLPTTIIPRPKNVTPWNYEFHLLNGKKLWVRLGKKPTSFIWGIQ